MERPHVPRAERHCVIWEAIVKPPGCQPIRTRLFDVSRTGVRVRLERPVVAGQIVPIEIFCRPGESIRARIVVIRCNLVAAGHYVAGAKLVSLSPPDRRIMDAALKELEAEAANSHTTRRRLHPFRLWRLFAR
jgi:hypothetical protein